MKTLNHRPPGHMKKVTGVVAAIVLPFFLLPGTALATTAANAVITNTASVDYDDTGGNAQAQIQASVNVTVNLVTAAPTLSTPLDATTPSGVALDYTYTITNNSNGLDSYTLSSATSAEGAGITTPVPMAILDTTFAPLPSIVLGATSAAAFSANGTNTLTVPNDGAADAVLNGIAAGDTIVIGANSYVVQSITDVGSGTETITLTTNLVADVFVGTQIGERGTFILRTTPVTSASGDQYTMTLTATDGANPATDDTITTVTLINLTVTKYVANITNPVVGGGSTVTLDTGLDANPAITYYTTGVTGNPGDVLEYVIAVTNAVGSGTATNVVISDPVPNFTALTGNIALDDGIAPAGFSNVATTADNGDFAESDGATIYIYAGDGTLAGEGDDSTGAPGVGNGTGGRLAAGATTYGAFRVQITP